MMRVSWDHRRVAVTAGELVAEGQAALRAGDAAGARRAFGSTVVDSAAGDVIEGLARASYLELDFGPAIEGWEHAYAAHRRSHDRLGAVRVARTLAYMYGSIVGDGAVMGGWLARAQSLLGADVASPEAGWVTLNIGMWEGDRERREARFRDALEVAQRVGDSDLEFVALAYLGATLVHDDHIEQGMVLLDEALAAVAGREVDDFCALQEIFCQLFAACEHAHDVSRADQWIRVGESIAARRQLPAVSAFCRTHYGGVLTTAGRWPEADVALTEAVRLWGLGHRSLRGGALARLADLRVRQGRYEEAERLLDGLEGDIDAARPCAVTQLARGETELACDTLERALGQVGELNSGSAPLLAVLVDVHLAAGKLDDADAVVGALEACAARHPSPYLAGSAALARGRLAVAVGTGDPHACFREALAQFEQAQMPIEVALVRLELAGILLTERPEVARAEARVALAAFARLEARRHVDAAAALLRQLGVHATSGGNGPGSLTTREAEVLELLSHGRSNAEISDRLFISRKTVEHHVGHVLAKLGLRSRSEAAAWATRTKSAGQ
jgi:DNA-binding CsgD family transcriptional regulator